jgi:hypothetical protein
VDPWLAGAMPGESHCHHVLVVKAHPTLTHPVKLFHNSSGQIGRKVGRNCAPYNRAIVLMRDFYLATFAEYQRFSLEHAVRAVQMVASSPSYKLTASPSEDAARAPWDKRTRWSLLARPVGYPSAAKQV